VIRNFAEGKARFPARQIIHSEISFIRSDRSIVIAYVCLYLPPLFASFEPFRGKRPRHALAAFAARDAQFLGIPACGISARLCNELCRNCARARAATLTFANYVVYRVDIENCLRSRARARARLLFGRMLMAVGKRPYRFSFPPGHARGAYAYEIRSPQSAVQDIF
jgi:hypothetical protein